MTLQLRSLVSLVALSALLTTGASADASVMGVELFVNGELVGSQTAEPDPNGAVPIEFDVADRGFHIDGLALLDIDPFISFSLTALNFDVSPTAFIFLITSPFVAGPFNTLSSEFSSSITDSDSIGGASAAPLSGFMSIPQVDGTDVLAAALGAGCSPVMAPGSTVDCDPFSSASGNVVTLPNGTFGVALAFVLSGGDSLTAIGNVELTQVPEPVSVALLCVGFGGAALRRRRSR